MQVAAINPDMPLPMSGVGMPMALFINNPDAPLIWNPPPLLVPVPMPMKKPIDGIAKLRNRLHHRGKSSHSP